MQLRDYTLIDVGGGMRDAWGAGILDAFMDSGITFPSAVGVSAGASNIATYIAGQRGRLKRFYTIYPKRKQYMGLGELMRHGSFINMKYIYEDISFPGCEDPFGIEAYHANPMDLTIVATDAETGKPVYFPKDSLQAGYMKPMEASGTIPVLCKPTFVDGHPYYDGGISDPIPHRKAFELGAVKLAVILTKPKDLFRDPKKDELFGSMLSRRYPEAGKALLGRAETYNRQLRELLDLEKEGKAFIIAPTDTCGVTTTKHKAENVEKLYQSGYWAGLEAAEKLMAIS